MGLASCLLHPQNEDPWAGNRTMIIGLPFGKLVSYYQIERKIRGYVLNCFFFFSMFCSVQCSFMIEIENGRPQLRSICKHTVGKELVLGYCFMVLEFCLLTSFWSSCFGRLS